MGVMRCPSCCRQVDIDSNLEDWVDELDLCRWCAEEELNKQYEAAQAAEDEHG